MVECKKWMSMSKVDIATASVRDALGYREKPHIMLVFVWKVWSGQRCMHMEIMPIKIISTELCFEKQKKLHYIWIGVVFK